MKEIKSKIKVLTYDDYNELKSLIQEYSDSIDIERVEVKEQLNINPYTGLKETDVVVFDCAENYSFNWREAEKMKEVNPGLKTIMFTSMKNRKFRRHYLSHGIDFFMFKETEGALFKTIVKQIHSSKTRKVS